MFVYRWSTVEHSVNIKTTFVQLCCSLGGYNAARLSRLSSRVHALTFKFQRNKMFLLRTIAVLWTDSVVTEVACSVLDLRPPGLKFRVFYVLHRSTIMRIFPYFFNLNFVDEIRFFY